MRKFDELDFLLWLAVVFFVGFLLGILLVSSNHETVEEQVDTVVEVQVDTVAELASILAGGKTFAEETHYFQIAQKIHGTAYWFDDVDPFLVARLIYTESRADSLAESSVGAIGLGQVRPNIWLGSFPECGQDLRRVRDNICYTINILHFYQKRFPTQEEALLSYNGCKSFHCQWYPRAVMNAAD